jgi:hypothetical protein
MELIKLIGITVISSTSFVTLITFLFKNYFTEKIKNSVKNEYDKKLANHKSELDKEFESFKLELKAIDLQKEDKWKLKREACFEALQLADNVLSNITWDDQKDGEIVKGIVDTINGRKTFNKLATSCDSDLVMKIMKSIMCAKDENGKNINMGIIVDLRNAVRVELGFGNELDTDKEKAYFLRLIGDEK